MKTITVAIADNWKIFREGISLMLQEEDYEVVVEAKDIGDMIRQMNYTSTSPVIFILNAALLIEEAGKIEKIRLGWPESKIVAYDPNENQPSALEIENSGVDKYISKDEDFECVLKNWLTANSIECD